MALTVKEMIQRLSKANDRVHLQRIWRAYAMQSRNNEEVFHSLLNLKEIVNTWNNHKGPKNRWR